MTVDYKLIGARLQKARQRAGMTQARLAEEIGVSVGYISQIERGFTKVNLESLCRITGAIGCDLPQILAGIDTARQEYGQEELLQKFFLLNLRQKNMVLDFIDLLKKNEP